MKTRLLLLTFAVTFICTKGIAQNWTNVGNPSFSNGTTSSSFLYFGDMEIDAAGNVFVGYWDYGGKCNFAKNSGGAWSILPSPGTFAVGADDIEIHGTDYYFSYLGARGSNYYAFVKKYDGTSSWSFVGDSVLIGGVGQGGSFDFLLDNNGVPTIVGLPKTIFGNKTVKQFKGGAWITTCVIPNSAGSLFKDGSAIFDANNKLNVIAGGNKTLTVPPYVVYFALGLQIVDSTVTTIGDSIYCNSANGVFKIDNSGNSYLLLNDGLKATFLSYKLEGNKWSMISDTVGYVASSIGSMISADVSDDGKVIFSTLAFSAFQKSLFKYDGGVRSKMDTLNNNTGLIAGISDIVIHGSDVYVLFVEGGFTVMKHSLNGTSSAVLDTDNSNKDFIIYPNPAKDLISIDFKQNKANVSILDLSGKLVLQSKIDQENKDVNISALNPGLFIVQVQDENGILTKKLLKQ